MDPANELVERLTAFYQEAAREAPLPAAAWSARPVRRAGWLRPVAASVVVALFGIGLLVGLRMARQVEPRIIAKPTPVVTALPSASPTASPNPSPSTLPNWIASRIPLGDQVYATALDSSAVFALYKPSSNDPHDTSHETLARIDRVTGKITTYGPFAGGFQLVRTGAGLWVVGGVPGGQSVDTYWMDLVDPVTLQVRVRQWVPGQPAPGTYSQPSLSAGPNLLWLVYGEQAFKLDPATGKVLLSRTFSGNLTSVSVDPAGRYVYVGLVVLGQGQAVVFQLDASTGSSLASTQTGGGDLGGPGVEASSDGVWINYATGMMGAVEYRSANGLRDVSTAIQRGTNGIIIAISAGKIWLVDVGAGRVGCLDPQTDTVFYSAVGGPTALVGDHGGVYVASSGEVDLLKPSAPCQP
jgi:hypothetical protein